MSERIKLDFRDGRPYVTYPAEHLSREFYFARPGSEIPAIDLARLTSAQRAAIEDHCRADYLSREAADEAVSVLIAKLLSEVVAGARDVTLPDAANWAHRCAETFIVGRREIEKLQARVRP